MIPSLLVTGGAGFIGAHVTRALLQLMEARDFRVVILDDLSGGYRQNVPDDPRVTLVEGSITDHALVDRLFAEQRFRYVYHLAAYAAEGLSHFIRRFNYTNNVVSSMNVLNACLRHGAECLVFTSSIAVYGAGQLPMTESLTPQPEDPYGIAKWAVELDLKAAQRMFGIDSVIFRPHNVYGEFQNIADKYRNVVGIFMNQILRGEPMTIFGDGEQVRAFSYVGDIARVIARSPWVAPARNRVFNVGAERPYTVNELSRAVGAALGRPDHPVTHLPERREVRVAYSDHTACREVFGDPPETTLDEGLARMAAWVRQVGARTSAPFGDIEVRRGLPASWT